MKPIKPFSAGFALLIVFFLISCEEKSVSVNSDTTTNIAIVGKWNILNDTQFIGVGFMNQQVIYTGQAGDFFDFRTDGNVYIKEGVVLDTLAYKLLSDTTISITSFGPTNNGVTPTSVIANLSIHTATIKSPLEITPGGEFQRSVNLSR